MYDVYYNNKIIGCINLKPAIGDIVKTNQNRCFYKINFIDTINKKCFSDLVDNIIYDNLEMELNK